GRKFHDLYALRSLFTGLGGLLFLACCLDLLRPKDLKPLGLGLALIAALLGLASLLWWYGLLPTSGFYLGLNLSGLARRHDQMVLATTAFNRQYFNQLLIPTLAVAGGWVFGKRGLGRLWAGPVFIIGLLVMVLAGQRSPFVCLLGQALFAGWLMVLAQGRRGILTGLAVAGSMAGAMALFLALDLALGWDLAAVRFLGLSSGDQITGFGLRGQVWRTAWEMFTSSNLLGIGPGNFNLLARQYATQAGLVYPGPLQEVLGTAHNTLLQWLAEWGLPATLAALGLGWLLFRDGLSAFRRGPYRLEAGVLLTALVGLAIFAFFQHVFYVSAVAVILLGILGGLGALRDRPRNNIKWSKTQIFFILACLFALMAYKVVALDRPHLRHLFRAGLSYPEFQADGQEAWWISGRRAVLRYWASHPFLVIPIRNPHPIVKTRPMKVRVWVENGPEEMVLLDDNRWRPVKLDMRKLRGRPVMIHFETSYFFWPARFGRTGDRRMLGAMVGTPYPTDK
ncbi:MAG: O-antigen ligase family protein, partial [Chlorobiales bacterium]|nr:O-antigen ligase family protein [Chlorobiales bacterium]